MLTSRTWTSVLVLVVGALVACAEKAPTPAQPQATANAAPAQASAPAATPATPAARPVVATAAPAPMATQAAVAWTDVASARELDKAWSDSKVSVVVVKGEGAGDIAPVTQAIDRLRARLAGGGQVFAPYTLSAKADGAAQWMASRGVKATPAVVFVGGGKPPLVLEGDLSEAQLAKAFLQASRTGGGSSGTPSCGGGGGDAKPSCGGGAEAKKCGCGG